MSRSFFLYGLFLIASYFSISQVSYIPEHLSIEERQALMREHQVKELTITTYRYTDIPFSKHNHILNDHVFLNTFKAVSRVEDASKLFKKRKWTLSNKLTRNYDKTGRTIAELAFEKDGSVAYTRYVDYDSLGLLADDITHNHQGNIANHYQYSYGSDRKRVKTVWLHDHKLKDQMEFIYDAEGKLIKEIHSLPHDRTNIVTHSYSGGNLHSSIKKSKDGSIIEAIEYKRNADGQEIEKKESRYQNKPSITERKYNDSGSLIEVDKYDPEGHMYQKLIFEYDSSSLLKRYSSEIIERNTTILKTTILYNKDNALIEAYTEGENSQLSGKNHEYLHDKKLISYNQNGLPSVSIMYSHLHTDSQKEVRIFRKEVYEYKYYE